MAGAGIASPRFDVWVQDASEGRQEDLTLSGIANDIHAATRHALAASPTALR
jgi:hypothetical protein